MSIIIKTRELSIPIEIAGVKFEFTPTDENTLQVQRGVEDLRKRIESTNVESTEESIEESRKILKEAYEILLGEGSFDRLYERVPSVFELSRVYVELAEALSEELTKNKVAQSDKAQQYLKKKKK